MATKELLFKLGGHHAFTTKECPFLIFAAQSEADAFGDYVCSGSEEHRVYVWHLRHRLLLATLKVGEYTASLSRRQYTYVGCGFRLKQNRFG